MAGTEKKNEIIWHIIDCRWTNQLHQPIHVLAYYLNPKCYFSDTFNANEEVMEGVITCMDKMVLDRELKDKVLDELEVRFAISYEFGNIDSLETSILHYN